jgi:NADPH:quinone reductase-like Zn-dependent oxidoreductase
MTRRGITAGPVITPPKIIGSECIGVVEAVSTELQRSQNQEHETRDGRHGAKYMVGDVVVSLLGGMGRAFDGCYAGKIRQQALKILSQFS